MPPSTDMICPEMYEAEGRQRNATMDDTSSGSPTRRRGVRATIFCVSSWLSTCEEECEL